MKIEELNLSVRAYNCLMRAGVDTVEKLRSLSDEELMRVRNLGKTCFDEIKLALSKCPPCQALHRPERRRIWHYPQLCCALCLRQRNIYAEARH